MGWEADFVGVPFFGFGSGRIVYSAACTEMLIWEGQVDVLAGAA
jgi:hypothetical protein